LLAIVNSVLIEDRLIEGDLFGANENREGVLFAFGSRLNKAVSIILLAYKSPNRFNVEWLVVRLLMFKTFGAIAM
jgi:hypothetical protein